MRITNGTWSGEGEEAMKGAADKEGQGDEYLLNTYYVPGLCYALYIFASQEH